jgi:hypothetical protein
VKKNRTLIEPIHSLRGQIETASSTQSVERGGVHPRAGTEDDRPTGATPVWVVRSDFDAFGFSGRIEAGHAPAEYDYATAST